MPQRREDQEDKWSADARAKIVSKMEASKRPFAAGVDTKGWLELASTTLGGLEPPQTPPSPGLAKPSDLEGAPASQEKSDAGIKALKKATTSPSKAAGAGQLQKLAPGSARGDEALPIVGPSIVNRTKPEVERPEIKRPASTSPDKQKSKRQFGEDSRSWAEAAGNAEPSGGPRDALNQSDVKVSLRSPQQLVH